MNIAETVKPYRLFLRTNLNSRGTAETYFEALKRFLRFKASTLMGYMPESSDEVLAALNVSPDSLNTEDFEGYKNHMIENKKSTAYMATEMSALVRYLKYLNKKHSINNIDLIQDVKELRPKVTQKIPDHLEKYQIDELLEACEDITEEFLIAMLFYTGARIDEILSLTKEDITYRETHVEIKVLGKGDKERTIPLSGDLIPILDKYLKYLADENEFRKRYSRKKAFDDRRSLLKMGYDKAWRIVKRVGERARTKVHPHMLRHSFGCELLRRGVDIRTISDLMGHKDLNTTKRYTKVVDSMKIEAVNLLSDKKL